MCRELCISYVQLYRQSRRQVFYPLRMAVQLHLKSITKVSYNILNSAVKCHEKIVDTWSSTTISKHFFERFFLIWSESGRRFQINWQIGYIFIVAEVILCQKWVLQSNAPFLHFFNFLLLNFKLPNISVLFPVVFFVQILVQLLVKIANIFGDNFILVTFFLPSQVYYFWKQKSSYLASVFRIDTTVS